MSQNLLQRVGALRAVEGYRELTPDQIAAMAEVAVAAFNGGYQDKGTPVIIPAHNEETDLPHTLFALACSDEPVVPIVVNNNSSDGTGDVAEHMGAIVVSSPVGKKMAATQIGVNFALDELGARLTLHTDADTLMPSGWSAGMRKRLEDGDEGNGAAVFAESIIWDSGSVPTDVLMNLSRAAGIALRRVMGRQPHTHGHNFGIVYDAEGQIREALMKLSPELFSAEGGQLADDVAIAAALNELGVPIIGSTDPAVLVWTRGDRVSSLGQAVRVVILRQPYEDVVASSYSEQYNPKSE